MSPSYLLVLLGVVMVSYSGPLVTLGLQHGANPATIAMMRMAMTAVILLPVLFVPPLAKILLYWGIIRPQVAAIAVICVISTVFIFAVSGLVTKCLQRKRRPRNG